MVYVNGTAAGVQAALGLTAAEAAATGGKWVAVHSGDAPFTSLTQALTLSSELGSYVPVNPGLRELATVHIHGHAATPVTGSPSSTASQGATGSVTLFVSASGPKVPIGATMVLTKGKARETKVVAFTKWGAPVDLSPPAGAVDYATHRSGLTARLTRASTAPGRRLAWAESSGVESSGVESPGLERADSRRSRGSPSTSGTRRCRWCGRSR